MSRYLILRLEGPLMAFGEVAVDELRPSGLFPAQSMLTGLLANTLGWDFAQGPDHQRLQERVLYGARLDRAGEELGDYQTVRYSKQDILWLSGQRGLLPRAGGEIKGPVIRHRYYRADSRVTVALTLVPEDEDPSLDRISRALLAPARPLFLGRVSCPPAAPVFRGETVEADSPLQALQMAPLLLRPEEPEPGAGLPAQTPWKEGDTPEGREWAVRQVTDQRDWQNQIHTGRRLVVETLVEPPVLRLEVPL